jgi:hypothetical protein
MSIPESEMKAIGVRKKRWVVCFENTILDLDLSIYEKMVYIVLCAHAKKDGPCFPSVKTISEEASCSRTKVFEALKTLEERRAIARAAQIYENRGQTSNLYEILDIDPRPQDEPGSPHGEWGPSTARTGPVRETDTHIKVLEQDYINKTLLTVPPLPPQGSRDPQGGGGASEAEAEKPKHSTPKTESAAVEGAKAEFCSYEAIVGEYNAILPELPRAGKVTPSRAETLKRRIGEDPARWEIDWWTRYFRQVREFPWPMGDNPYAWRADFGWLTGDRGMQKILDGGFRRSQSFEGRTEAGAEMQKKYTDERGEVDAWALLRELDS